ncbi:hypothetical protein P171DRAFT_503277 [Karstenula rhodostoma CBS 690.94]|uniref:Uncharacterized protein n=1 Tax=Karstenula rhodostoma CBS 690.94 TaxID=1392251 RepID=A0A9P4PWL3_9PLEO|nr:hypothetical protein P171DRAFT_503277 [Karstenula rhodostoma CBS 690.94]
MDISDRDESLDGESQDHDIDEEASNGGEYAQYTEDRVAAVALMHYDEDMANTGTVTPPSRTRLNQVLRLDTTVAGLGQSSIEPQANDNSAPVIPPFSPLDQGGYSPMNFRFTENPLSFPNSPTSPFYSPRFPTQSPTFLDYSPTSPAYSPVSPRYSPTSPMGPQPWYKSSTEFEVRIVRFRRSRIGR